MTGKPLGLISLAVREEAHAVPGEQVAQTGELRGAQAMRTQFQKQLISHMRTPG